MQSHLTIPYVWWDFSQDQHALQLAFGVLVSDRATPRFRGASEIASYSTTPHFKQRARGALRWRARIKTATRSFLLCEPTLMRGRQCVSVCSSQRGGGGTGSPAA